VEAIAGQAREARDDEFIAAMNMQAPSIRPICSAVVALLGVTLIAMAIGLADKMGVIDTIVARRAIGFAIGLMLMVVGNSLSKMRPLHSSRATASERLSGWVLVRAGNAWIALFAFAPLNLARYVAALTGMRAGDWRSRSVLSTNVDSWQTKDRRSRSNASASEILNAG
jgi:hypothetical protein